MTQADFKIPFYAKITISLIGIIAFIYILNITEFIVVPLVFAIIIAIVLSPVVDFFQKIKIHRVLAILLSILLTFIVIAGIGILIVTQVIQLSESWPQFVDKFTVVINQAISSIADFLKINPEILYDWIAKTKTDLINISGSILGQTIVSVGNSIAVFLLMPVYIFLILFYQPILLEFINRASGEDNRVKVNVVVNKTKIVVQHYLVGLMIETGIIAILNTSFLLILGIDYAILIGLLGALLNLIPYLGGAIAISLPVAIALATKSSAWYSIYVIIGYSTIQFIDNNYIVPRVVASKVKINALFSIIVVLAGNALWGVAGMFLSIPIIAIVKLIFDNIQPLKPWGYLLGDTMPSLIAGKRFFKKKEKK